VIGTALGAARRELYFWGGIKLKRRLYNVFLQGQFRHSTVEFSSHAVEPLVAEAWLGLTWQISRLFRVSYATRYQTAELEHGRGGRDLHWAGFIIARDL
jgi:hypothetical protein